MVDWPVPRMDLLDHACEFLSFGIGQISGSTTVVCGGVFLHSWSLFPASSEMEASVCIGLRTATLRGGHLYDDSPCRIWL